MVFNATFDNISAI